MYPLSNVFITIFQEKDRIKRYYNNKGRCFKMKKYDITVVGGGFAGTAAAIAAARAGKKVLLLEKTGMLGGAASN